MGLIFKKPTIKDSEWLHKLLENNHYWGCELSASNMILWSDYYHIEVAEIEQVLITRVQGENGRIRLSYPIGAGSEEQEKHIFDMELELFRTWEQAPCFGLIDPEMYERIQSWYPQRFQIQYERDWADYIYDCEKLTTLAGKKLHGKRNHIKQFQTQNPEWVYETIDETNVEACIDMAKKWCRDNCCQEDDEKEEEFHLVIQALRNHQALGMKGGLLRTAQGVVAFTLGCPITRDTFDVSFEKAYSEVHGAYPMINQQFVQHELQQYKYINREEDVGVEGLRKAKLSYYPELLLKKGILYETCNLSERGV